MKHLTEAVAKGTMENGELQLTDFAKAKFKRDRSQMANGPVSVTIERQRAHRSHTANRYYWFILGLIEQSDVHGQDKDSCHDFFKKMFLETTVMVVNQTTGQVYEQRVPGSSRKLYVAEFYDYVEKVRQFCAESLDLVIPDPDPDYWMLRDELIEVERRARFAESLALGEGGPR